MSMRRIKWKLFSFVALVAASAVFIAVSSQSAGAVAPTGSMTPGGNLANQITQAYQSASGVQVRDQLASLLTDPALPATANELLQAQGPAGANTLTTFQVGMLKALIRATEDPALLSAILSGKPLSGGQLFEELLLRAQLSSNPAVRTFRAAGSQLQHSSELTSDISSVAAGTATTYPSLTLPPTAGQGGSADLDTVTGDFASLRTSADFNNFASQLGPVLAASGFQKLVESQSPLIAADFLPVPELLQLQLHSGGIFTISLFNDIVTGVMDILLPIAGLVIGILTLPEDITALVAAGLVIGIVGTVYSVYQGVQAIGNDLDCDHDGDPFDPDDAPGLEC